MTGVALITGGQRGIGLAIAKALHAQGMAIAVASNVPKDDAQSLVPLGALYIQHDVTDLDAIPGLLDKIEAELGPITTLVNNAGIGAPVRGDPLEMPAENWDLVQNVNLRGPFFLTQAVAKRMLAQEAEGYRSILFVSSVSAQLVSENRAEYCVSKAGVSMATKVFALRLAEAGIGVFELQPGIIATEMTEAVKDSYTPRIEDGLVPARRWGTAGDVAEVATACVTGQMKFSTGAAIPVDGGLSIGTL